MVEVQVQRGGGEAARQTVLRARALLDRLARLLLPLQSGNSTNVHMSLYASSVIEHGSAKERERERERESERERARESTIHAETQCVHVL